jgi:predicted dehydrogenase
MYKLAFIGGSCESIAGYPHFIASQMDRRFEVVSGVFSSNKETNKRTAQKWNVKSYYDDIDNLIKYQRDNIDVISILTPTPIHIQALEKLLKLDIPIICEKPLVSSFEDIRKIEKILENKKRFLVVTNNYSGYPMVRELKQKILNNELGDILHIRLKMPQESFLRPPKSIKYPQKWRLQDGFVPMISLDLGAHLHHLAYFLLSEEPNKIMATYNSFSNYNVIDDVTMLLEYESGIKGSFWLSKTALGNRNGLHIEIYGSKASAIWHQENPEKLEFSYFTGQKTIIDRGSDIEMVPNPLYHRMTPGHPSGYIESFANLYNDIANCLDDYFLNKSFNSNYVFGFEHAKNGIKLLHNASISNQNQHWQIINNNLT